MLHFFRSLRKKLLSDNQLTKYILYAIGEIVLVMIGILLALQVNNWNEAIKHKAKEKEFLLEIVSDLETNIQTMDRLLNNEDWNITTTIHSIESIIDHMEADKLYHDSMAIHFNHANRYDELSTKTSGYESITSIGIDLILDADLRSQIGEYYSSTIKQPGIAYSELRDDYYHYMLDYLRNDFVQTFNKADNTSMIIPRNYAALKEKPDYIESLKIFYDVNLYYRSELKRTLQKSIKLKKEVENYSDIQ